MRYWAPLVRQMMAAVACAAILLRPSAHRRSRSAREKVGFRHSVSFSHSVAISTPLLTLPGLCAAGGSALAADGNRAELAGDKAPHDLQGPVRLRAGFAGKAVLCPRKSLQLGVSTGRSIGLEESLGNLFWHVSIRDRLDDEYRGQRFFLTALEHALRIPFEHGLFGREVAFGAFHQVLRSFRRPGIEITNVGIEHRPQVQAVGDRGFYIGRFG